MFDIESKTQLTETITSGTHILDFWAEWCGPCKALTPVLEEVESNHAVPVLKINVDEHPEIAQEWGVMSIPSVFYVVDGETKQSFTGAKSYEQVIQTLGL